jgi:hypothetical protein
MDFQAISLILTRLYTWLLGCPANNAVDQGNAAQASTASSASSNPDV